MQLETMYSTVDDRVATVTLNRPQVLNCANEQWARDLNTLVDDLAGIHDLRVVVVRGAGRAFCSGIDLTALSQGETGMTFFRNWEMALRKLETLDAVVIAAIHSHCIGGGLQIALACDLRVARDDARFGITAVREGIIPGIGMWRVARHAGLGRAKRLALAADIIDAAVARGVGARRLGGRRRRIRRHGRRTHQSNPVHGRDVDAVDQEVDQHGLRDVFHRIRRDLLRISAARDIVARALAGDGRASLRTRVATTVIGHDDTTTRHCRPRTD